MRRAAVVIGAALATLAFAAVAYAGMNRALGWGSEGSGAGEFGSGLEAIGGDRQFNSPGGIVVTGGRVFVADTSNNRIQRFSLTGSFQASFGRYQFDPGSATVGARSGFILPEGVAADSAGNLFIADNRNDRVVKYTSSGRFLKRLGRRGSIGDEMVSPWGIAVDGSTVYVVDQGNAEIKKFSTAGSYRGSFSSFGVTAGHLQQPYGIAADTSGNVYVSDTGPDRIYKFSSSGRLRGTFGSRGSGAGEFNQPAGLALDASGNLLVADCANQRIQRISPSGKFIESFGRGSLIDPTFVAAGPGGSVFVSDFRRVVRFDPTRGGTEQRSPEQGPARSACVSQAELAQ